jgi:hypothetical protein
LVPVLAAVLIVALAQAVPRAAQAGVRVEGRIESVVIVVHDAPVRDALAALSARFALRVHDSRALDRSVTGTYRGTLRQVVAQLLAGLDYVARHANGTIEVRILGPGIADKSRAVAGPVGSAAMPQAASPAPASIVDKGRLMFVPR